MPTAVVTARRPATATADYTCLSAQDRTTELLVLERTLDRASGARQVDMHPSVFEPKRGDRIHRPGPCRKRRDVTAGGVC